MKVLFVCQGNINRSQVAEAVYRSLVPDDEVQSAGAYADYDDTPLSEVPGSVDVMREKGFDISAQTIKPLTSEMVEWADKVVVFDDMPRGPLPKYLQNNPKVEEWDVPDPGYGAVTIAEARDMVMERVARMARDRQSH